MKQKFMKLIPDKVSLSKFINQSIFGGKQSEEKFKKIYQGSKHGYNAKDFHRECDGKFPTVTIILSREHQRIFGGYTDIPWRSSGGNK